MSSQEEYLDQLLKDMLDGDRAEQDTPGTFGVDFPDDGDALEQKDRYDIDDLRNMSIDDVNRILEESSRGVQKEDPEKVELGELLSRFDEPDLQEIHEILDRTEKNIALDESIVNMIESAKQSERELPQDLMEELQLQEEEDSEDDKSGLLGNLFGKKKKKPKRKTWERKKAEDFEYEMIELFGNMELIDGEEQNKTRSEKFRDKWKARREAKALKKQEAEEARREKKASVGGEKKKRKRHWRSLDDALNEMTDDLDQAEDEGLTTEADLEGSLGQETVPGRAEDVMAGLSSAEDVMAGLSQTEDVMAGLSQTEDVMAGSGLAEDVMAGLGPAADAERSAGTGPGTDPDKKEGAGRTDGAASADASGNGFIADGADELAGIREKDPAKAPADGLDMGLDPELLEGLGALSQDGEEKLEDLLDIADKIDRQEKGKKKGLFSRLFDFLTEEDEEQERGDAELILSDENDAILKELEEEGSRKKKKKKPKKGKDEEADEEVIPKKEKKPKKPKKVKEPKQKEAEEPGKKLSKRRVFLIFLVCFCIGGAFLVLSLVTTEVSEKKKATAAFRAGDYEECYQNLVGKNLNESEQVMFGKSESILRIRLWMREYEMLAEAGREPEALDSLMQSVHDYPTLYAFSGKWNAVSEVQEVFDQMLSILRTKYHLTEEEAKLIANEEDDLLYSRMVRTIAAGGEYGDWEQPANIEDASGSQGGRQEQREEPDRDLLPEEEGFSDIPFAD